MANLIDFLPGFYGNWAATPVLPSFYTEFYSQEDRLKAISKILNRVIKWNEMNADKINELVDAINKQGDSGLTQEAIDLINDIPSIKMSVGGYEERISSLEANLSALVGQFQGYVASHP